MTLRGKQSYFSKLLAQLITWIFDHPGWEVTFADFYRGDNKGHMKNSCHYIRLAADLNLFINGVWQDVACAEWKLVGEKWKALDPMLCRWGGDFDEVDLNHFSMEHEGRM